MEVNRLLSDELTYELMIRELPVGSTVENKRALLRDALRMERAGEWVSPRSVTLDGFSEISTCENKLVDLQEDIVNFNHSNRQNEFKRISTRLLHINLRLGRLQCENPWEEKRTTLIRWCDDLLKRVKTIMEEPLDQVLTHSLIDEPCPQVPHTSLLDESSSLRVERSTGTQNLRDPLHEEVVHPEQVILGHRAGEQQLHEQRWYNNLEEDEVRSSYPVQENVMLPGPEEGSGQQRSASVRFREPDNEPRRTHEPPFHSTRCDEVNHQATSRRYEATQRTFSIPTHDLSSLREQPRSANVRARPQQNEPQRNYDPPFSSRRPNEGNHPPIFRRNELSERTFSIPINDIPTAAHNISSHNIPTRVEDYSQRVNSTLDFSTQLRQLQLSPTQQGLELSHAANIDNSGRWDVHRWGLKYDGQKSLTNFLERLEELRRSRGVPKGRLLQSAVELFEKDALLWYRMNTFSSWEDLVNKLKEAFRPYDYESSLWDEIRLRTQGAQERVISFVSAMENLFRKLSSIPVESERIRIIRRNLLPRIQTQMSLTTTPTINDLIRTARMIEETEWRIRKFCPPPSISRNLMEPELAYRRPASYETQAAPIDAREMAQVSKSAESAPCWNCGQTGHKFRKCQKKRRIFCFKCGKADVISAKCPDCSKNPRPARQ